MAVTKRVVQFACVLMLMAATAEAQTTAPPPPGVIVEAVKMEDMAEPAHFPGLIGSPMKVQITTPASGTLGPRQVADGAMVEKGALLFTIDKTRYQALLAQSQAQLVSAEVARDSAQVQFDRTSELVAKGTIAKAQLQTDQAALKVAEANVKVQQAAVLLAQLDLDGTDIHAPFEGRLGQANFAEGAMVGPGSGGLATLMSLDPMRVRFYVRQRALLEARDKYGADVGQLILTLMLADGSAYAQKGKLLFTDVEANTSTDSVSVVGEIPNPDKHLLDGQLVTVLVGSAVPDMQLAVSQAALLLDQSGTYVLTVDSSNKVQVARLVLGARKAGRVAVTSGLAEGDRVIVAGMQKVAPGMVVAPAVQAASATGTTP